MKPDCSVKVTNVNSKQDRMPTLEGENNEHELLVKDALSNKKRAKM